MGKTRRGIVKRCARAFVPKVSKWIPTLSLGDPSEGASLNRKNRGDRSSAKEKKIRKPRKKKNQPPQTTGRKRRRETKQA